MKTTVRNTITLFMVLVSSQALFSQKKEIEIKTHKVADNLYMLEGMGGNIGIFVSDDEVFMIDSQFKQVSEKITEAIRKITDKPIKLLVNTHWHGDHTGGNGNFKNNGATIFSHENVRKRMQHDQTARGGRKVPKSPEEQLPVITFSKDMMFHLNGEDILVSHTHNAHTDGDSHVYFMTSNVIHMGDTYFQGKFPFIDLNNGGSIDGYIESAKKVLLLINDDTVIIPGHRNLSNKQELKTYLKMLETLRERVSKAIKEQKTLEEVSNDESITQEYKEEYGGWFISAKEIRETIYKSLKNSN